MADWVYDSVSLLRIQINTRNCIRFVDLGFQWPELLNKTRTTTFCGT